MPYELIYDESTKAVISNYSGVLTDEEFRECAAKKFNNREAVATYLYSVSDLSQVTGFEVSVDTIRENAAQSKKVFEANPAGFMVVIAPENFTFGLSNLWGANTDASSERVKVFRNRADADAWIAARLEQKS